jgi:hypothetical protein
MWPLLLRVLAVALAGGLSTAVPAAADGYARAAAPAGTVPDTASHDTASHDTASHDTASHDTASHDTDQPSPQPPTVQLGTLVQTVLHAAGRAAASEGLHVPRARLEAEGQADVFSFEVEGDFADEVELKDARITYHPAARLTLGAGHFDVPFSYGELVSSAETDFVQRPRVARQLGIGRRTGVDASYRAWNERVHLQGGIFRGQADAGAPEDWLAAARMTWASAARGIRHSVGFNAVYVRSGDTGRIRLGADVRLSRGPTFLTAELLAAPGAPAGPGHGAYVTTGYALTDAHLIRAQWDYVSGRDAFAPPRASSRSVIGVGYTLQLADPLRMEVDYLAPTTFDALVDGAILINLQVSL